MYSSACETCSKIFESTTKNRKFCSKNCYDRKRRPRSDESKEKIRFITKKYYKNASDKEKKSRWGNISKSKIKTFSPDEVIRIESILNLGYILNSKAILHHSKIFDKSKKILENYKNNNKNWFKSFNITRFIPLNIQMWDLDKFDKFKRDCEVYDHRKIEQKYILTTRSFLSLSKKLNLKWGKIEITKRKETKPERIIRLLLDELNISHQQEKYIMNGKYRVDFLLSNNKIIEVNGDYWHANPLVFDYERLNNMQKNNVLRDIQKNRDVINNGFMLLEIWEKDINENINDIKTKIEKYAE